VKDVMKTVSIGYIRIVIELGPASLSVNEYLDFRYTVLYSCNELCRKQSGQLSPSSMSQSWQHLFWRYQMRLDDYQKRAMDTDRLGAQRQNPLTVALCGLAGETGSVHTLYKKRLRDGDQFTGFRQKVKEELGDILSANRYRAGLRR
jgi:hypothetical protein